MKGFTIESMMSELNNSLAVGKRSLEEMRSSGDYTYNVRGGCKVEIPSEQFDAVWDICDDAERLRLRLPIYVSTDTSSDSGAWKVEGKVEAAVVAKLLGKRLYADGFLRIHYSDYKVLKTLIPDAIMVIFAP